MIPMQMEGMLSVAHVTRKKVILFYFIILNRYNISHRYLRQAALMYKLRGVVFTYLIKLCNESSNLAPLYLLSFGSCQMYHKPNT